MPQRMSRLLRSDAFRAPAEAWGRQMVLGGGAYLSGEMCPSRRAAAVVDHGTRASATEVAWRAGAVQRITLGASISISWSQVDPGARLVLVLAQDATGGRTVTWPWYVRWPGGTAPALSTDPGSVDLIEFIADGVAVYGRLWG